ncbi:MAG TPA: SagB/ThcOx family dehydrogenase [Vicinamibacterales bacterium]|nr:SagB/ThcOx family dehydrogenase [Vicinamibacterales bacterium]
MIALEYHDATKHAFHRFARSLGYLDWATQPDPFRRYAGAPVVELPREAVAADVPYRALFDGSQPPAPIDAGTIGEFLRCSMGLSAWKHYRTSRWALRVNPSSGNLHPTEAYLVWEGRVCHYAPRAHALEERAVVEPEAWRQFTGGRQGFLAALTSIHWREAWKYGERAFRYCQHDAGHAIAAMRLAAAMLGWRLVLLPWTHDEMALLLGVGRQEDRGEAEAEEPECVMAVTPGDPAPWRGADRAALADAARRAPWRGVANRLSPSTVDWPIIDRVAHATRAVAGPPAVPRSDVRARDEGRTRDQRGEARSDREPKARQIILQRRSALAFDGRSSLSRERLAAMLARLRPCGPPWDAIDWPPLVHLALFVHRVDGLVPGLYAYLRDEEVAGEWRCVMRPEFLWEGVEGAPGLFLLVPADVTWPANRVSCDQDIASDGFFALAMIARVESTLRTRGEWMYRRLFWECGLIGQVLYLEAEAAGARSTGIGCFYDDPMHEVLGLSGHEWQSLYHFSMGMPVEDPRLTTEPGYAWEA